MGLGWMIWRVLTQKVTATPSTLSGRTDHLFGRQRFQGSPELLHADFAPDPGVNFRTRRGVGFVRRVDAEVFDDELPEPWILNRFQGSPAFEGGLTQELGVDAVFGPFGAAIPANDDFLIQ